MVEVAGLDSLEQLIRLLTEPLNGATAAVAAPPNGAPAAANGVPGA